MRDPAAIVSLRALALDAPMRERFAIARGSQDSVRNALVRLRLADGTIGWGEAAPFAAFNGETQAQALAALRSASWLEGRSAASYAALGRELGRRVPCASARAALEMALLDAWTRRRGLPLRLLFGGAGDRVATDVTIAVVPPDQARAAGRRISRLGVTSLKVKVGLDPEADAERVAAACSVRRWAPLIVDGNAGYSLPDARRFLRKLKARGIRPDLFEQPLPRGQEEGFRAIFREGVPVAADESVADPADALRLARSGRAQVLNIKLMKAGVLGALEIARIGRAAGLGLMIGGMIESRLAMACAAHLAAGFGGFSFVDLDTPLLFARDPMRGVPIRRGGVYDLRPVRGGIGVRPSPLHHLHAGLSPKW